VAEKDGSAAISLNLPLTTSWIFANCPELRFGQQCQSRGRVKCALGYMERGSGTRQRVWCLQSLSPFTSASSLSRLLLQSPCWPPQPLSRPSLFSSFVAASWHGRWPSTSRIALCYMLSPQSSTGFITPARKTLSTGSSGKMARLRRCLPDHGRHCSGRRSHRLRLVFVCPLLRPS
jgi:hypothetical protein